MGVLCIQSFPRLLWQWLEIVSVIRNYLKKKSCDTSHFLCSCWYSDNDESWGTKSFCNMAHKLYNYLIKYQTELQPIDPKHWWINTQIPATARCPEDNLYHLHLILLNLICVCAAEGESGPKWFVDAWGQGSMVWLVPADTKRQQQVKCLAAYKLETQMGHSRTLSQGRCSRQRTTATTTAHPGSVALGREKNRNEPAVM